MNVIYILVLIDDGEEPDLLKSSKPSWERLKRPISQTPVIPKCRVISPEITDKDICDLWKKVLLEKLQNSFKIDSLEEVLVESTIKGCAFTLTLLFPPSSIFDVSERLGDDIRRNATRIGKSGVVQVDKEDDIPYWALSAMTCLANWPNSSDTGE